MPLLLGLLYSFMFKDDTRPTCKLGVVASAATQLPVPLQAATKAAIVLTVQCPSADEAALTQQVQDKKSTSGCRPARLRRATREPAVADSSR